MMDKKTKWLLTHPDRQGWTKKHLWDKGLDTWDMAGWRKGDPEPSWICNYCHVPRGDAAKRNKLRGKYPGVQSALDHVKSEEHRSNKTLAKLGGE